MAKADHNRKPGEAGDPLILAMDCSTRSGSVALARGTALLGEAFFAARPHSEVLLPAVDFVLHGAGFAVGDVDCFAVARGPGAFTGLRIAVTTAKGLAAANGRPLVAVSTLEALALNAADAAIPISTVLDARRGEIWAALWEAAPGGVRKLLEEQAIRPDAWAAALAERAEGPILFLGDGVATYRDAFQKALGDGCREAQPLNHGIRAAAVARLGLAALRRGETADLASLAPAYLRGSEAQVFEPPS